MDEKTCEGCFWFTSTYEIFGRCRNPRNATVGHAGSDYSSSDLLKPLEVRTNMVCDFHEPPEPSTVRQAYEIEAVPPVGTEMFDVYRKTEWRRKQPTPPTNPQ